MTMTKAAAARGTQHILAAGHYVSGNNRTTVRPCPTCHEPIIYYWTHKAVPGTRGDDAEFRQAVIEHIRTCDGEGT